MSVEPKQPFMEHLDELLLRLRKSFMFLVFGFVIGYALSEYFINVLSSLVKQIPYLPASSPLPKIMSTGPFEIFWVHIRVSMVLGAFIAFPLVAWEVSKFVSPGLKDAERSRVRFLFFSIYGTFLLGIFLGYQWVLPAVLSAIVRFNHNPDISNLWTLSTYVNNSLGVLIVTALLIQLPVIMTHLSAWGWVQAKTWGRVRRQAIVVNAVVSGILSPPDIQSMIAMMVPVHLLYEAGIIFSKIAEWMNNGGKKNDEKV